VVRFGALGLRGRIIGVVLVTAAAALAVAAITLLSNLESSLKSAEGKALKAELQPNRRAHPLAPFKKELGLAEKPGMWGLYYALLYRDAKLAPAVPGKPDLGPKASAIRLQLDRAAQQLQSRIGASDVVLISTVTVCPPRKPPCPIVVEPADSTLAGEDNYSDAAEAIRTGTPQLTFATIGGTDYARAALAPNPGAQWALVVRKPISEVSTAVSAVRTALLDATLVAAALTLLLAIPFAVTVVRRLRLLRQTALRVAQEGPAVEIPVDRARDEVGDLARTFALMQHQLRRQEEARRAFVATASHELRTPVASLDGLLELLDEDLQSGQPDLDDARSLLERARGQSKRLGRLAADLLDLSRIDAQTDLRSEPVELGELSRAVLAEFDLGVSRRGIVTTLDDEAGAVWALGDPGSVARILRILLDNAIRLSPQGGQIKIELRNGDHAQLSVCDRGPGVPLEERELIFERFMRGREAGGRAGFGLGLAIGRELARRMGGDLVLEEQEGPGARFTLRLPVARAPQEDPVAVA
jgi:signal transduction histidine kinase